MAAPMEAEPKPEDAERRDGSAAGQSRRSIYSVPVTVTVSIGQARLSVSEILELQPEAIVPLTSRIDDPVDLMIDNKVIAKGELVETEDGSLGVKITEIPEQGYDDLG